MLKTLNKKFTNLASAVAFAECGEWDYAREFLGDFDSATKSSNRKFVVIFKEKVIEQSILDYALNLSKRLCYDIIFLHVMQNMPRKKKTATSVEMTKQFFQNQYHAFLDKAQTNEIDIHYFISAGKTSDSLEKLYHKIGHVEFAILQDGIHFDDGSKSLGLPLFVYRQ